MLPPTAFPATIEYTPRSPQVHLAGPPVWRAKQRGGERRRAAAAEAVLAATRIETALEERCPGALPPHAVAEAGVVVAPAAQLADAVAHLLRPVRVMQVEPLIEQVLHFPGQPQQDITRSRRALGRTGLQDGLELVVVDRGNHRRVHQARRNPGRRQPGDRREARPRRRCPRLHPALQLIVERRHTDKYLDQSFRGELL